MLELKQFARWALPWSLLAGMILTLLFLGSEAWQPLHDCAQRTSPPYNLYAPPGGCSTIDAGYPVRFLSSHPLLEQIPPPGSREAQVSVSSDPVIDKGGLVEDWLIWSLVSSLVLYYFSAPGVLRAVPYRVVRTTAYVVAGLGAALIVLSWTVLQDYNSTRHHWLEYTGLAALATGILLRSRSRHRLE